MTTFSLIVAMDEAGTIGKGDGLPWTLPNDLRHFKKMTSGHTVVMGRTTFETLGRPLPNRKNVVLSREEIQLEGCTVVTGLDELFDEVKEDGEVFVIGGRQVYDLLFPFVTRCHVTRIEGRFEGDTFLDLDLNRFQETSVTEGETDEKNPHRHKFHIYERPVSG